MPVRILISGEQACFPRPECRLNPVTYDVITPVAARGLLNAIYWRPGMRWIVDTIRVLSASIMTGFFVKERLPDDRWSCVTSRMSWRLILS